jgi:hypothetical protein
MTIRDLQYAIQDAIDEKGVDDEAQVVIIKKRDGKFEIFAAEVLVRIVEDGELQPYPRQTLLGRV